MDSPIKETDLEGLPGTELVLPGLADLRLGRATECALLLLINSPRLKDLGLDIPSRPEIHRPYEHRLFELLEDSHGAGAHSRYNSLLRRIVSFTHALEQRVRRATSPA